MFDKNLGKRDGKWEWENSFRKNLNQLCNNAQKANVSQENTDLRHGLRHFSNVLL